MKNCWVSVDQNPATYTGYIGEIDTSEEAFYLNNQWSIMQSTRLNSKRIIVLIRFTIF